MTKGYKTLAGRFATKEGKGEIKSFSLKWDKNNMFTLIGMIR